MKANFVSVMIYFFLLINIIISNKTSQYHCGTNNLKIKPKNLEPKIEINIEDPSYKRRMSNIDKDGFKNFNIYVDKINIEKDIAYYKLQKYQSLILNSIDKAASTLGKLLKVKPLVNRLQFSDEELNDIEIYNWDWNKFGDSAMRRNIDMNSLGIDLIIFSKIEDLEEYTIAQASSRYTQSSNHQPILGIVEINSNINFDSPNIDKYLENTLIHEMTHVLGFSGYFFEEYFNFIMKKSDKYGKKRVYINSTKAVEMARKYFNCPSLDGIELEDYGDEGTAGSHWEARILLGDYMNGISYTEEVISEITLALLEDLGFYKANYYTGGLMRYGKNKGCEFVYDKCVDQTTYEINPKFENEFIVNMLSNNVMGPSCSSGRLTRMYSVWRLYGDIPEEYQYNEDNDYGGWSAADYCPVPVYDFSEENKINYSGICSRNEGGVYGSKIAYIKDGGVKYYLSKNIADKTGEEISENSFCFLSSLYKNNIQDVEYYSKTIRPICYKLFCSENSLTVKIHDNYIVCPRAGGKIKAKGYEGYFLCPDYNLMCSGTVMCNDLFDCVDKQSEVKEESFIYDYEIKTSQNIKKAEESDFDINNYELSEDGICQKNCKQCQGNKKCLDCREGYILLGNYQNDEVICEKYTNNKYNKGYFTTNDIHYKCIDFCDECSNKDTCDKCEDGVEYQNNQCINYNIPNCAQTDASGVCKKCDNNFAFNDTDMNFCININEFNIDNYYTKDNGMSYTLCSKYISNCEQCEYDDINKKPKCKLCEEDYSLSINENKCILKEDIVNDKEYYYIDDLGFKCQKCSDTMNYCEKCENGNVCVKCMKGTYFMNDKIDTCYQRSKINIREFFLNENKTTYLSCNSFNIIENCKECTNKYYCNECMDGYIFDGKECYYDKANHINIYNSFFLYLTFIILYLL